MKKKVSNPDEDSNKTKEKEKEEEKEEIDVRIKILNNLLMWEGGLIQISNISDVDYFIASPPEKPKEADKLKAEGKSERVIGILMCVVAVVLCWFGNTQMRTDSTIGVFLFFFGLAFAVGGFYRIKDGKERIHKAKQKLSEHRQISEIMEKMRFLYIRMNSGIRYVFHFPTKGELEAAYFTLGEVIANGGKPPRENMIINATYVLDKRQYNDKRQYKAEVSGGTVNGDVGHIEKH